VVKCCRTLIHFSVPPAVLWPSFTGDGSDVMAWITPTPIASQVRATAPRLRDLCTFSMAIVRSNCRRDNVATIRSNLLPTPTPKRASHQYNIKRDAQGLPDFDHRRASIDDSQSTPSKGSMSMRVILPRSTHRALTLYPCGWERGM